MKKYIFIAIIILAALTRIIPHPWNFTGVGALALFAGSHFKERWQAIALTWVSMFVGDLYFGLHSTMFFTYGALALTVILGHSLYEKNISEKSINRSSRISHRPAQNQFLILASKVFSWVTLSLVGSSLFYLITNFGVWSTSGMYEKSFAGLMECYLMGLPFLNHQVLGDLIYLGAMLGISQVAQMTVFSLEKTSHHLN